VESDANYSAAPVGAAGDKRLKSEALEQDDISLYRSAELVEARLKVCAYLWTADDDNAIFVQGSLVVYMTNWFSCGGMG
jgi:hypothetical protein